MGSDKELTLGEFLRSERESRGVTLEQVASATKVGIRTLHALEADQYSELPAKPYIRGFVASYCAFIGLDPGEVRTKYDDYITLKSKERPNREGGHSGYAFEKKDGQRQSRIFLSIAMVSFLLIGGIAVLFLKPTLKHRKSSHLEKLKQAQEQNQAQEQAHIQTASSTLSAHPSPAPSQSASPLVQAASAHQVHQDSPQSKGLNARGESTSVETQSGVRSESKTDSKMESKAPAAMPGQFVSAAPGVTGPTHQQAGPIPSPLNASAVPIQSPPRLSPSVLPASGVAPTPMPSTGSNPKDPLDSGHELNPSEVKHRLVFHTLKDVWVRFRVDGRPTRKFVVRAGRNLVLKAQERVVFQVSDPSALTVVHNQGQAPRLVSEVSQMKLVGGEASLVYAESPVSSIQDVLEDAKPLPKKVDPKRE